MDMRWERSPTHGVSIAARHNGNPLLRMCGEHTPKAENVHCKVRRRCASRFADAYDGLCYN